MVSRDLVTCGCALGMGASTLNLDVARDEESTKVVMKDEKVAPCRDGAGRRSLR